MSPRTKNCIYIVWAHQKDRPCCVPQTALLDNKTVLCCIALLVLYGTPEIRLAVHTYQLPLCR